MNLMQGIELQLKHVHAVGIYGWGSVCETIIGEWLEDISQNQVLTPSISGSWEYRSYLSYFQIVDSNKSSSCIVDS